MDPIEALQRFLKRTKAGETPHTQLMRVTEKSRGNTTVTVPVHLEFAKSLRAGRAAGIIGADVFTGEIVRGRVAMNKKAWAAKLKKYAVLAGVNEPKLPWCTQGARGGRCLCRLHREPDDGHVQLDGPEDACALHRPDKPGKARNQWHGEGRRVRSEPVARRLFVASGHEQRANARREWSGNIPG